MLECELILITSKLSIKSEFSKGIVKIEENMIVDLDLKKDNRFKSKKINNKTYGSYLMNIPLLEIGMDREINIDLKKKMISTEEFIKPIDVPADSIAPFAWGFPPCMKIIWENGDFTDKVFFCDEILDLYYMKE